MSNEERIEQLCEIVKHLAVVTTSIKDYDWIESEVDEIIEDIRNTPSSEG
jgi:hypothetical protein